MDLFSLGFVLLILAVSGLIAWVADGLGKKIGKKRLSIFGLRPKHVASLGTVAMGVAVSFLTIGFIATASSDVRKWLRKGTGLIVEVRNLEGEVKRLQDLSRAAQVEKDRLLADGRQLRTENDRLGRTNVGLSAQIDKLKNNVLWERTALDNVRTSLLSLRNERLQLNTQVASLKTQVSNARRQYVRANGLLAQVETKLRRANHTLHTALLNLKTTRHNLSVQVANVNEVAMKSLQTSLVNQSLLAEKADREAAVAALKKEQADLIVQRDAAEKDFADAKQRYNSLLDRLTEVGSQLAEQQENLASLQSIFAVTTRSSRIEAMTFRRGEEVARVVVPAGATKESANNILTSLLRTARQEAESRGAKTRKANGQTYEAADIVDRKDPQTGEVIDADTLRRALLTAVSGKLEDQVIVASSSLNAFAGEPVSLDLRVLPNPLVYHRNQTVAEAQIDGAQSEDRILAQLSAFMVGRVREKAVRDRMVPRLMTPAPFGELSTFEVLNLVRDVKQRGRPVRVQAVADVDIRAADPLRLEFRVR